MTILHVFKILNPTGLPPAWINILQFEGRKTFKIARPMLICPTVEILVVDNIADITVSCSQNYHQKYLRE